MMFVKNILTFIKQTDFFLGRNLVGLSIIMKIDFKKNI